jgi:hypothetical protein
LWSVPAGAAGRPSRFRAGSGLQQDLYGAAFVHRPVGVGGLLQPQFEVEDPAGVDRPLPDQVDQLGQVLADRGGTAVQVGAGEPAEILCSMS